MPLGTASAVQTGAMDGDPCECNLPSPILTPSPVSTHPFSCKHCTHGTLQWTRLGVWASRKLPWQRKLAQLGQHLELVPCVTAQFLSWDHVERTGGTSWAHSTQHAYGLAHRTTEPPPVWLGPILRQNLGHAEVCASHSPGAYQSSLDDLMHRALALKILCDELHVLVLLGSVSREAGQQPLQDGKLLTGIHGVFTQLVLKVTPPAVVGVSHHNPGVCFQEAPGDELLQAHSSWVTAVV